MAADEEIAPRQARIIHADEGTPLMLGRRLAKVSMSDSDGRAAIHTYRSPAGLPGPPLHRHLDCDEAFIVMEGELLFRAGDLEQHVKKGGVVYVPRGVVHAFANVSDSESVSVEMFLPADLEPMFFEVSALVDEGAPREDMVAVWAKYRTEVMGPPLSAS